MLGFSLDYRLRVLSLLLASSSSPLCLESHFPSGVTEVCVPDPSRSAQRALSFRSVTENICYF